MRIINTNIAKHPLNWVVIFSMFFVTAFIGHLLISYFTGNHPGSVGTVGPGTTTANTAKVSDL